MQGADTEPFITTFITLCLVQLVLVHAVLASLLIVIESSTLGTLSPPCWALVLLHLMLQSPALALFCVLHFLLGLSARVCFFPLFLGQDMLLTSSASASIFLN